MRSQGETWEIEKRCTDGKIDFYFLGRDTPEDFQVIMDTLRKIGAEVISETKGPYSTVNQIRYREIEYYFVLESICEIFFFPDDNKNEVFADDLVNELQRLLKMRNESS